MATTLNPTVYTPPQPAEADPVATRDLLNTLFFYKNTALTIFFSIFLVGVIVALVIPPSYTARARVLTLNDRVYEFQNNNAGGLSPNTPIAVDVEMQLLDSSELHRDVIRRVDGPGTSDTKISRDLATFEGNLHLSKLETGDVIEITYRDRDPERAANMLKTLLTVYFEERADVLTAGRLGFLTAQRDKVNAKLDEANKEIAAYQTQTGVVDVTAQIASAVQLNGVLQQRVAEAQSTVANNRESVDTLEQSAKALPEKVELYTDTTEQARTVGEMETQLFQLEAKRADLAARYMPTSPFVTQADSQIKALKNAIDAQKRDGTVSRRTGYNALRDTFTDRLAQAKAAYAGSAAQRNVLEGQLGESKDRLKDLITISDNLAKMTSQRDLLRDQMKDLSTQVEQARVQQNEAYTSGTTNVRVIEQPRTPYKRSNPRALFIAAAFVTGLLVAGVVVILLSSTRETFLSPQEAQRALRLPVIADLPERGGNIVTHRRDFGRLIAALDSTPTGQMGKTLLLLSANNEGRVQAVAKGVVDALEFRSPDRIALVHMEEESSAPPPENALPARPMGLDKTMTLPMNMTRRRLVALFHELRSAYDYVVITAPPASQWFESLELASVADLSALVVGAEETRKPVAQNVLAQAKYIGGRIAGLIMTGRRFYIPGWLYRLVLEGKTSRA